METNRLGNWEKSEREALARRLRRSVKPASGYESRLWEELLRRLEHSGASMSTEEAALVMGLERNINREGIISPAASHLRQKVEEASRSFTPDPGVYLTRTTYAIGVTTDPPTGWKQNVGPSIGLLLADAGDGFIGGLIRGIGEVCERFGHDLIIDMSNDDPVIEARKLARLFERTHGVLIVPAADRTLDPASRQLLEDRDCVLIDRYIRDVSGVLCVHPDDISAGRQAGLYLSERGCKRVFIVDQASRTSNHFAITPLEDRVRGCQIQLRDTIPVRHLPSAGSDEQGGFDALEQLEKRQPLLPTDGIYALTDRLATGCRHYLDTRDPHLNLPLIGTEGKALGDYLTPALASIGFDNVAMGKLAAEVLFAKLQETSFPASDCAPHFLLPPTLLKPLNSSGRRQRIPISFPDAARYYMTHAGSR